MGGLTVIGVISGSLPTTAKGSTATGWLYTDSGPVTGVQLSTNGTTWSSSVTVHGSTIVASVPTSEDTDIVMLYASASSSTGTATIYVRVQYGFGVLWSDAYSLTWKVYAPVGAGFYGAVETIATGPVYSGTTAYLATKSPDETQVFAVVVPNGFTGLRVNGTSITSRPAVSTDLIAVVKVSADGTPLWTAWATYQSGSAIRLDTAPDGSVVVLLAANGMNTTFHNQDGTSAGTSVWTVSGTSYVVAALSPGGNWTGSARIYGQWTGLRMSASNTGVLLIGNIAASQTSVTVAGTSVTVPSLAYSAGLVVKLTRSTMSYAWSKRVNRFSGSTAVSMSRCVIAADDSAYVSFTSSQSGMLFEATPVPNSNCYNAVAKIDSSGATEWVAGPGAPSASSSFQRQVTHLALTSTRLIVTHATSSTTKTTFTDGSISVNETPAATGGSMWAYNLSGTPLWAVTAPYGYQSTSTQVEAPSTFDGGIVTALEVRGAAASSVVRARNEATGTEAWAAQFSPAPGYILRYMSDASGNLRFHFDSGNDGDTLTFTSTDSSSTSVTQAANFSLLATLSPSGMWGQTAGTPNTPGTGSERPDPPASTWPSTYTEGNALTATVTGYDPELTGGTATLELRIGSSWVSAASPVAYKGGTITIGQFGLAGSTVYYETADGFYGSKSFDLRWKITDPSSAVRTSAATRFTTSWTNVPEAPDAPEGEMPNTDEDVPSVGTFTIPNDPDNTGTYTWSLSPQTTKPATWDATHPPDPVTGEQDDWHTTTGSTITVEDDGSPVGSATIASQNDSTKTAQIQFTPASNWHGYASFDVAVSNGNKLSDWVTVSVVVDAVTDKPGAPSFTLPSPDEGESQTFTVTWTDPDDLDGTATADGAYTLELAVPPAGWTGSPTIFDSSGVLDVGPAIVRVLSYSSSALSALLRVEVKEFANGPYELGIRVSRDATSDPAKAKSNWAYRSGEIGSVPTAPFQVSGTMPVAKPEQSVTGTFTTSDPDSGDTSWTFTISSTRGGTYGSVLTLSGVGTLTVVDANTANKLAQVRLDQQAGGSSKTRYAFWIKVTDSDGLSSTPVLVTGYVLSSGAGVWLQRLDRTSTGASVERLCPLLTVTSIAVTDSLDGSGGAEIVATASELQRRADDLGMTPQELLAPGAVEVVVYQGAQPLFVGPVYAASWNLGSDEVTVSAMGLLSYFQRRAVNTDVSVVNADWSTVIADLVDTSQSEVYGDLDIDTTAVGLCGTSGTIEFTAETLIGDAIGTVLEQVGAPEAYIDAQRVLRCNLTRGSDKTNVVRVSSGMVTVTTWDTDSDGVVTVAHVVGAEKVTGGNYKGSYADTAGMETWGRLERVYTVDHLTSDAACDALAQKIVNASAAQASRVSVTFTIDYRRPFTAGDIEVGDTLTLDLLDDRLGRIAGEYRVINRTLELAQHTSNGFILSLDLEPVRRVSGRVVGSRSRHNPSMLTRLSQVELLQRNR